MIQSVNGFAWFVEASVELHREQLLFCHRCLHSPNEVVYNICSLDVTTRKSLGKLLFTYVRGLMMT